MAKKITSDSSHFLLSYFPLILLFSHPFYFLLCHLNTGCFFRYSFLHQWFFFLSTPCGGISTSGCHCQAFTQRLSPCSVWPLLPLPSITPLLKSQPKCSFYSSGTTKGLLSCSWEARHASSNSYTNHSPPSFLLCPHRGGAPVRARLSTPCTPSMFHLPSAAPQGTAWAVRNHGCLRQPDTSQPPGEI